MGFGLSGCANSDFELGHYQMTIDPSANWHMEVIGGYGPGGPDVHAVMLQDLFLIRPELNFYPDHDPVFYIECYLHSLNHRPYAVDLAASYLSLPTGRKVNAKVFLNETFKVMHAPGPVTADFREQEGMKGLEGAPAGKLTLNLVFFDYPRPRPGDSFDVQLGDVHDGDTVIHVPLMHFHMDAMR